MIFVTVCTKVDWILNISIVIVLTSAHTHTYGSVESVRKSGNRLLILSMYLYGNWTIIRFFFFTNNTISPSVQILCIDVNSWMSVNMCVTMSESYDMMKIMRWFYVRVSYFLRLLVNPYFLVEPANSEWCSKKKPWIICNKLWIIWSHSELLFKKLSTRCT